MDDVDDYIVDDISLDGETLALLDQEEQKYLTLQKDTFVDAPPVSKKRRTNSGWRPGHPTDEFEDLPEISVHGDGTYGVRDVVKNNPASATRSLLNNVIIENASGSIPRVTAVQPSNAIGSNNIQERLSSGTKARNMTVVPQRASMMEVQLQELQHRIFELSEENKAKQLELQQAMDLKLIKEGEASILRRNLEKATQDHAAQITSLKAAREEADAKQLQIQKEMRDEIERMKTQLLFKQQEIESSHRRVPSTARASRIYRDPLRTPMRPPFEQSQVLIETPSKPFLGQAHPPEVQRIETPRIRRSAKSPRKINLSGVLPGFQNAFLASPLVQPQPDVIERRSPPGGSPVPRSPPSSPTTRLVGNSHSFDANDHSDVSQNRHKSHAVIENDFDFVMVEDDERTQEADVVIQPFNWTTELSRIIITHILPDSQKSTLQLLLETPASLPETEAGLFAAACSDIFKIIANTSDILDYTDATRRLSVPLVSMLFIVGRSEKRHLIQSLVHLLMSLVLSVPAFGTSLVVQTNSSTKFSLHAAIREIAIHHLEFVRTIGPFDALLDDTLGLLEALCLRCEQNAFAESAPLVADAQVWAALLRTEHKESTLTRSCRLLILLASYPSLARTLVNVSSTSSKDGDRPEEPENFVLIDRLCTFLCGAEKSSQEFNTMREHILTFFATLSLSHLDAQAMLANNNVLIPSLVHLLFDVTNALWEDEGLTNATQNIAFRIKATSQTVTLMHQLVFGTEPSLNLRLLLHHSPRRTLTGLNHMFIICFGRLSWAEPPEWIDKTGRRDIESLADMARELLDLVVDGPESDSIWSLYQENSDKDESEMDEGDIEARLMAD